MSNQQFVDNFEGDVAGFISKTYEILNNEDYSKIIHWGQSGKQFIIRDVNKFQQIVLPQFFRHKKINSFIRQLNMYGFHKSRKDNSKCIFSHPSFLRGREDLLIGIKRKVRLNEVICKTPIKQSQFQMPAKRLEQTCTKEIKQEKKTVEEGFPLLVGLLESRNCINSFVNLSMSLKKLSAHNFDHLEEKDDDEVSIQQGMQEEHKQRQNIINPSFFFCSFNELNLN